VDTQHRRLKIAGFSCLLAAVPLLVWPGERLYTPTFVAASAPREVAALAGLWVTGALLVSLGFILLLAGLQGAPLLTSARARRGLWTKLGGALLLVYCFAYVGLGDAGLYEAYGIADWMMGVGMVLFLLAVRGGLGLLRTGWKYDAVPADVLLANDPRPPVLYLRSFVDDGRILPAARGRFASWMETARTFLPPFSYAFVSFEQELARGLQRVGPVVAIGRPGERLPELGASRLYVGDDEWQDRVSALMSQAALVVLQAGDTPSLWWEVEQAMARVPRRRLVIVCSPGPAATGPFLARFASQYGAPADATVEEAEPLGALAPLARALGYKAMSTGDSAGWVLYFDRHDRPCQIGIHPLMTLSGLFLGATSQFHASVNALMRHLQRALDLPPAPTSQTTAVLLALFGGLIGLHHFYLGDRRRGWRSAALCWLVFPAVGGWRDAVRMALMARREFGRTYAPAARHN
jgi:TM2 domain-containing membrane protein YozV